MSYSEELVSWIDCFENNMKSSKILSYASLIPFMYIDNNDKRQWYYVDFVTLMPDGTYKLFSIKEKAGRQEIETQHGVKIKILGKNISTMNTSPRARLEI